MPAGVRALPNFIIDDYYQYGHSLAALQMQWLLLAQAAEKNNVFIGGYCIANLCI